MIFLRIEAAEETASGVKKPPAEIRRDKNNRGERGIAAAVRGPLSFALIHFEL